MRSACHIREFLSKQLIQLFLNPCSGRLLRCCFLLFRFSGFRSFCLRFLFISLKVATSSNFFERCCFRLCCRCFRFCFLHWFFCHVIEVEQCHLTFCLNSAVFLHRFRSLMIRNAESFDLFKTFQMLLPMRSTELLHIISCIQILQRNAKIAVDCGYCPFLAVIPDMIADLQRIRLILSVLLCQQLLVPGICDSLQRIDYTVRKLNALIVPDNLTHLFVEVFCRIQRIDLLFHGFRIEAALRFFLCRFFRFCFLLVKVAVRSFFLRIFIRIQRIIFCC